jgi:superfamily II DNA/RNA helicase
LEKSKNTNSTLSKTKIQVFGWVSDETLANKMLLKNSSKFTALILNILKHKNTKHMVYSIFKIKAGVVLLNTLLTKCGIKSAIFSGDLDDGKRSRLLSKFNSPENRNGELIQVILLTEAGEQGITLLETNNVHILESSPHNYKIQQAIGRAARFKSHVNLPPERNYVNVWRYWSTPLSIPTGGIDEILFNRAKGRQDTIDNFNTVLKNENIESI